MKQAGRSRDGAWLRYGLGALGVLAAVGVTASAGAQEAAAPSKAACARAYESSQESRAAGRLQETRQRLLICAHDECPSFVQKDCTRWLDEVERELPSVVLSAPGLSPEEAGELRVTIDGQDVPDALDGRALTLDPGRHELVAERPGQPAVTRVILAQQGVQERAVTLELPEPAPAATSEPPELEEESAGLRQYAYVAWGVGAVGLGVFAVLGTLGRADEQGLKDDCPSATTDLDRVGPGVCYKPRADDRKAIYEREFLLADVGLVAGLVGLASGTVLFLTSPSPSDEAADAAGLRLDVAPTAGGAFASVRGAF